MGASPLLEMPRGPLTREKSGTVDEPSNRLGKLREFRDAAIAAGLETLQMNAEYGRIPEYIDLLEGKRWTRDRAMYRSPFYDNKLGQARLERLATLSDIKPTIDVFSHIAQFEHQANALNRVIAYEWHNAAMGQELTAVIDHALFSVGYWKLWATLPGRMGVITCGMDQVLLVNPGAKFQDASTIAYQTYRPLQYLMMQFPRYKQELMNEAKKTSRVHEEFFYGGRPQHIPDYTYGSMSPKLRRMAQSRTPNAQPAKDTAFPVLPLTELWVDDPDMNDSASTWLVRDPNRTLDGHNYWYSVQPNERLFPRKRLIVFAGDFPVYDGPSPYWHGLYPFGELILRPTVWRPGGLSMYRDMVPLNRAKNEIVASICDLAKRAANPSMIGRKQAFADQDWEMFHPDMPGAKARITGGWDVHSAVKFLEPAQLPQYVGLIIELLDQGLDRASGALDITQLRGKKQLPGGETIEQMRDSLQGPFRLESERIAGFLRAVGTQAISHVFQHYTHAQRMRIAGHEAQVPEDFDFEPGVMTPSTAPRENHWKNFGLQANQGSLHSANRAWDAQLAMAIGRLGFTSRREVLRQLQFSDDQIDRIDQELAEERQEGLMPIATGKGRVPRLSRSARTGQPM